MVSRPSRKDFLKSEQQSAWAARMFAVVVFVYLYISSMKSNEFTFTIPSIAAVITKAEFSGWSIIFVMAWFEEQKIYMSKEKRLSGSFTPGIPADNDFAGCTVRVHYPALNYEGTYM